MFDLTKEEAYVAMLEGACVTREHFSNGEFLFIDNGVIKSEEGYEFNDWWHLFEPMISSSSEKCFKVLK